MIMRLNKKKYIQLQPGIFSLELKGLTLAKKRSFRSKILDISDGIKIVIANDPYIYTPMLTHCCLSHAISYMNNLGPCIFLTPHFSFHKTMMMSKCPIV